MAGNLDKALLQMAGFEDEGDLYAKAGTPFISKSIFGIDGRFDPSSYQGLTGKEFQYSKDRENDAAQYVNDDARLNALLYAWSKDNPGEQITPELIDRMKFFAATADSMRSSGGFLWGNGTPNKDENVKALIKLIQKDPKKANSVLGKDYNRYNSSIQNYFDWAGQYMDSNTSSSNWENLARNFLGGDFADNVAIASRHLGDKLNAAINNPNYGLSEEEIAKKSKLAEAKAKIEAEEKAKRKEEARRKNLERAGLGYIFDPEFKNDKSIPDEWL